MSFKISTSIVIIFGKYYDYGTSERKYLKSHSQTQNKNSLSHATPHFLSTEQETSFAILLMVTFCYCHERLSIVRLNGSYYCAECAHYHLLLKA